MPDVPVYNFRRDFDKPTKSKAERKQSIKKPLGYRKYAKDNLEPTDYRLPHPFKCSRCEFIGHNRDTLNKHYFSSH
jgi:hypothetical protein